MRVPLVALFFFTLATSGFAVWPPTTIPDGWGVQLKGGNDTTENLEAIRELGLKYVRRGFMWGNVEKQPGVYDFTAYDRLVADCKTRDLSIIGCIAFGNSLYDNVRTEAGRAGYAKFAAALADRYRNDAIVWELWNEPNTMTFWGKHGKVGNSEPYAEEYLALVRTATAAMHQANPKAIVLGGSVSGLWSASFNWMRFAFGKGILQTGLNAWSLHPYTPKLPEDYPAAYGQVRSMMTGGGAPQNMPLVNSERGFPLGKAEGATGGVPALKYEYQAWHLVRQYLMDLAAEVKVTIWYEWSGKEGFSLHQPGEPLPAEKACRVLIAQLRGYRLEKRLELGAPRDFAYRFSDASGGVKVVAWTAPPTDQSPDKAVPHTVRLPVEGNAALVTADLYGKPGTVTPNGGAVELALTGAPQYLTVRAGRAK